jgi:hypothetical protein
VESETARRATWFAPFYLVEDSLLFEEIDGDKRKRQEMKRRQEMKLHGAAVEILAEQFDKRSAWGIL